MEGCLIKMKCTMCNAEAEYTATETNEPLCEECAKINEGIKERDYPSKLSKYPLRKLDMNPRSEDD